MLHVCVSWQAGQHMCGKIYPDRFKVEGKSVWWSFNVASHSVFGVKEAQWRVICSDGIILKRNCSLKQDGQWDA